ncbi:MAG: AMP-binding protein [Candidatus Poribacteria bacterium]|nr:AMP-binding protein [Candidatus Poribacteria bacterium]
MSITDFFHGKVLLITGGTAFLGQPMVAKILTSLPDVKKIYLLIRSRVESNGKVTSAQERFEKELLTSDVFDALRHIHGEQFEAWVKEKIAPVEGELTDERLGFNDDDYQRLQNEVDVFINIAGLVQFDPPFDASLKGNALAAKHVVTFAKGCSNAIFLHVSTAYVCGDNPGTVPEELHPPFEQYAQQHNENSETKIPATLSEEIDYLLTLNQSIRDEAETPEQNTHFQEIAQQQLKADKRIKRKNIDTLVDEVKTDWLEERLVEAGLEHARARGWNDTYTYMKFLAEQVIMELRGDLPTAIVRPSIIESSFAEPHPGWLGKYRMSEPLIVGFAKGRLPDFPADPDIILDIIPVDFVVNAMLAAAEGIAKRGGIEVYHVATGTHNPLYFRGIVEATYGYFVENPMMENGKPIAVPVWTYPSLEEFKKKLDGKMRLLDTVIKALTLLPFKSAKRKRRRLFIKQSSIKAALHYIQIYAPYTRTNFEFETNKLQKLYKALSPEEQQSFNFDVSQITWKQYFQEIHIPGIKRHVLKLEDDTSNTSKQQKTPSQDEVDELPAPAPNPIDNIAPRTIVDLIEIQAKRIPDKIALQMVNDDEWERYTYAETYTHSRRIAYQLWNSGLRKDDRVVLVSENQPEWCIAYLAASQIGCAIVPLDAQTPIREILAITEFTTAKAILASDTVLANSSAQLTEQNLFVQNINQFNDIVNSDEDIPTDFPNVEVTPDTVASIIFTMGTTVDAKGAMLTHGGFISNVKAVAKALPPTDEERILSALPLYHALSFSCSLLMTLYSGTTATYVNAFRPTTLLKTMREDKTTAFISVPRLYQMLQSTIERQASREDTPGETLAEKAQAVMGGHIRVLVSGGAALTDAIYDGFQKLGLTIYQGYGMTETAPVLSVNPYLNSKRGSVGPAVEGVEFKIVNTDNDGIGEIIAKGPSNMKAYYQNQSATENAIRDGWLYTGDLGYIDDDGYLYITGHCKDIIVPTSGKNIYPVELEALYQNISIIAEMCVVGIPYDDGSDIGVHTVIVPVDNKESTKADIYNHLQQTAKQLPSYQQFHKSHLFQDALPKTENGTIDRERVKELLEQHLAIEQAAVSEESNQVQDRHSDNIPEEILSPLAKLARMPANKIRSESRLDTDLGLDSLTRLDLLMLLEARLGQTIPEAMVANLQTVNDVVELTQTFDKTDATQISDTPAKPVKLTQKPHWYARAFRAGIRRIYQSRFSFECFGLENIPQGKPYIITPNHTSHLDTLTVITALGQNSHQLWTLAARDYWFGNRLQGWFAHNCLNALPIERDGNFSQFLQDLRMANEVMEQNNGLLIFPEGTRSLDGNLQPFKQGILSLLIYGQQVPIIPAFIKGTFQVLPKGQNLPKKHPIQIVFGEPLLFESSQNPEDITENTEVYQKFLTELENRVAKLGETLS